MGTGSNQPHGHGREHLSPAVVLLAVAGNELLLVCDRLARRHSGAGGFAWRICRASCVGAVEMEHNKGDRCDV